VERFGVGAAVDGDAAGATSGGWETAPISEAADESCQRIARTLSAETTKTAGQSQPPRRP
jgi:hypothetical protein